MPRAIERQSQSRYPVMPPPYRDRKPVRGSPVWWLRFFGIVAFIVVLLRLPQEQNLNLSRIDLRWLGFAMLLTIGQLLLEAFAWQWLLFRQRIRYPYPKTIVAYLASQYLGLVTPGHVGEFLGAGYISMDTGITFGYALSSVVMKKVLSWAVLVSFGIWGLQLLAQVPLLKGVQWIVGASAVVLVALSCGIAVWVVSLRRLGKRWRRLSPWQVEMPEFWSGVRQLASPGLIVSASALVIAFSLIFVQLYAVLQALGVSLPWVLVAQMVALSRIVARVIPISVVGWGTKDAAIIAMLAQHGIAETIGLAATLLLLLCSYLVTLLLSGLCWWIKPLVIRRAAPSSS
jgi:uncharacterized membrane protein YbhN (UPF0104 family)